MQQPQYFIARVWPETDGFVAECLELGIASQGDTEDEAIENLREAVGGFLLCADHREIEERLHAGMHIRPFAVAV